jgi:18S rRNA (guanine1575-N7)-methyltransferase
MSLARETARPEERGGGDADLYYDHGVAEAYTELNFQIQSELTTRCLDMLCLEPTDEARDEVLLDIGCGSGLSGETLARSGYRAWVGVDASAAMLERATRTTRTADAADVGMLEKMGKTFSARPSPPAFGAVLRGDFSQGLPFRSKAFDGCVSVSAAQWLCAGDDDAKSSQKLTRFFRHVRRVLKPGARAALQTYPRNVRETRAFETTAALVGLTGISVVAFPHKNKSKKIFVCVERDAADLEDGDVQRRETEVRATAARKLFRTPRCPLAWPHAATCELAWRRFARANARTRESSNGCSEEDDDPLRDVDAMTRTRCDREHLAVQRRALRSLRRARTARRNAPATGTNQILAWDLDTERDGVFTEVIEEILVRDGTLCPCARLGVVTSVRVMKERRRKSEGAPFRKKTVETFEDPISLVPVGRVRDVDVETTPAGVRSKTSNIRFQEFCLRTSFGDFGAFALEADGAEVLAPERTVSEASNEALESRTFDAEVVRRAILAFSEASRSPHQQGSILCATVLSSEGNARRETRGMRQVWCLWWPNRETGGSSREEHFGFRETPSFEKSVAEAFERRAPVA